MNIATIGAILFALSCWALPIQTAAQTYTERSPQAVPEIHDQAGANTAQANNSEREEESEETKVEVTKSTNARPTQQTIPTVPPKPKAQVSGWHYSKEEVIQLIKDYSARYGVEETLPLAIAKCESGYRQFAKNNSSTASGVFQYLNSTWQATDQGKIGLSVFDADANVKAAISYIASRGHANPWNASRSCWSNS